MARSRTLFDGTPLGDADPYDRLLDLIVRGEFAPGSRLTEPMVASQLHVSRTPAREAMHRLTLEGLLVPDGGGARPRVAVAPLDGEEARDLYRTTGLLEGAAARTLTQMSAHQRQAVARMMHEQDVAFRQEAALPRPDPAVLYVRHHQFHQTLVDACATPVSRMLLGTMRPRLARYEWFHAPLVLHAGQSFTATYDEHDRIVAAIERGSADQVEQCVRANWNAAAERLAAGIAHTFSRQPAAES